MSPPPDKKFKKDEAVGVVDIGSNTVLLVCGRRNSKNELEVVYQNHEVARLSEGLTDEGPLLEKAKQRVLQVLRSYQEQAKQHGVEKIYGAGTAAFRRAKDGREFANKIERELSVPVKILTGEEEARLSHLSAWQDFGASHPSLGVIDIGGGSTELVFGQDGSWMSLPMGTVQLLEKFVDTHPIPDSQWNSAKDKIQKILHQALEAGPKIPQSWVAVAATPTALANLLQALPRYEPSKVHGYVMNRADLENKINQLRKASLAEREAMPGMIPKRAELLPLGGLILVEILQALGKEEVIASDHGWRYGYLAEMLGAG